jgi:hypothetical protein
MLLTLKVLAWATKEEMKWPFKVSALWPPVGIKHRQHLSFSIKDHFAFLTSKTVREQPYVVLSH